MVTLTGGTHNSEAFSKLGYKQLKKSIQPVLFVVLTHISSCLILMTDLIIDLT